jgi:hypothetical protein
MRKKILFTMALLAMLLAWPLGFALAYEALIGPTGVLQWDKTATEEDLILFTPAGWFSSYLIDREGYILHEWKTNCSPGLHDRLLPNGHLLRGSNGLTTDYYGNPNLGPGETTPGFMGNGGVQEYDWDGKLVWEYKCKSKQAVQHHSFFRMPNGHTLSLNFERIECADAIAAGRDPSTVCVGGPTQDCLAPDWIEEVDATPYPGIPKTVKTWRVWDHIVQDRIPGIWSYGDVKDPKKFNLNFHFPQPAMFGFEDWNHANTVEYNDKTQEVIINFRNWGQFAVIDWKDGPTFGEIKARFGNPCSYGAGKCPGMDDDGDTYLWGDHCVTFLDNGHYLAFDNGWARPTGNLSRAVEIDPAKGDKPSAIVWSYQSLDPNGFFTTYQGGAQRLPNGNTFITSTDGGHLFEVTPAKKVVWEFVVPPRAGSDINDKATCTTRDQVLATVHRAHAYNSKTIPGLQGKDLSRKGHIALGCPEMWKLWDTAYGTLPTDVTALTGVGFGATSSAGGGGGAGGAAGGGGGGY